MTIRRKDIDDNRVDFSDIATGKRLEPVHPGSILRDEFLQPLNISVYELGSALHVTRSRLNDIVRGRRAITTDTAIRLARYFGTTELFWLNLQTRYDLEATGHHTRHEIETVITPRLMPQPCDRGRARP